jgi:hypothetical protein
MKHSELISTREVRAEITRACVLYERATHKLQLMSVRKSTTVTDMLAQLDVLGEYLDDLDKQMRGEKAKKKS